MTRLGWLLLGATLLSTATASAKEKAGQEAEVEIYATLTGKAESAAKVLIASKDACEPSDALKLYGTARAAKDGTAFVEVFVPQGSKIHICAAGLDAAGKIVAWGRYAKNPVKGQGKGEITFSGLKIELKPLSKPVAAPAGL